MREGGVSTLGYKSKLRITDEVLKYLEEHQQEVHKDMENRLQESKNNEEKTKKRHELSNSATNSIKHHGTRVTISFD